MDKFEQEKNEFLDVSASEGTDTNPRVARRNDRSAERKSRKTRDKNRTDKKVPQWKRLWKQLDIDIGKKGLNKKQFKEAKTSIAILLSVSEGQQLGRDLIKLFRNTSSRVSDSEIEIKFVKKLEDSEAGTSGKFEPGERYAAKYTVQIQYEPPQISSGRSITLGSYYPDSRSECRVAFYFTDHRSMMAETVFHELLHIWFLNSQLDATYPTGHKNIFKCQIENLFLERLRKFSSDLGEFESKHMKK